MSRVLRFGLFGHPVASSASPAMHRAAFKALNLPHFYDAIDCPDRASLDFAIASVRRGFIAGANVTAPHKRTALEFVDEVDPLARAVGATNLLVRNAAGGLLALNTDVPALADELRALQPATATALIVGAGGAASAALAACKELGVRVVAMTSRSWTSSEALYDSEIAEAFRARGALTVPWPHDDDNAERVGSNVSTALRLQWNDLAASADILIQATSVGMPGGRDQGHAVAACVPWKAVPRRAVAYDLVYGPNDTPFVAAAKGAGIKAAGGIGMLARQGALSVERWLGQSVPYTVLLDAARRYLATGESS